MPPHADQLLQERILKTAQKLWRTRGESGLTLRAVAREAGTTTPTVYKRFRNKQALRKALAERVRLQLNEYLFAAYLTSDKVSTLPPWVAGQMSIKEAQVGGEGDEWPQLSAAIIFMVVPLLAWTALAQRVLSRLALRIR